MVVVVVDVDGIFIGIEDTKDVEGNMDHTIEEVGVDMVENDEWQVGEDKTMSIEGNIDRPIEDVSVDMDEKDK